jgi:hypothetical protein
MKTGILITTAVKNMKCLQINLIVKLSNLFVENYKKVIEDYKRKCGNMLRL